VFILTKLIRLSWLDSDIYNISFWNISFYIFYKSNLIFGNKIFFSGINKNNYIKIIPNENILIFDKFNYSIFEWFFNINNNSGDI